LALLKAAIDYAGEKGVLLVVGAGNDGKNVDLKENFTYPVSFESENILTVAEIDFKGELYRYKIGERILGSNFGERNVDIAAIGMNYSTFLKNNRSVYALAGGTSNSTPVVTGVAALVLSVRPELNAQELKKNLMDSVTTLPSLKGKIKSGGMVNSFQAIQLARKARSLRRP
jgi:subtilisin family serine protease